MSRRRAPNTDEPPASPQRWIWSQHWRDVLFLHWRVDARALRPHVPAPLEIAAYDGDAWASLVLFRLQVRPRWLPFLPGVSKLVEGNLRTYVHCQGKPAIWFLSVHADNPWAIRLARLLTPMPYRHASMRYESTGRQFHYQARYDAGGSLADLTFRPVGGCTEPSEHSLDAWLLERYRLFVPGRGNTLWQAEVAHPRWIVQNADVSGLAGGFGKAAGLELSDAPDSVHFAAGVAAHFGAFQQFDQVHAANRLVHREVCHRG